MRIVDFSTRRPVTVIVFSAAAVVFGLVAFDDLAVDLLPEITYPSLTVRTEYEGVAPTEVEALITKPLENAVMNMESGRRDRPATVIEREPSNGRKLTR